MVKTLLRWYLPTLQHNTCTLCMCPNCGNFLRYSLTILSVDHGFFWIVCPQATDIIRHKMQVLSKGGSNRFSFRFSPGILCTGPVIHAFSSTTWDSGVFSWGITAPTGVPINSMAGTVGCDLVVCIDVGESPYLSQSSESLLQTYKYTFAPVKMLSSSA